jgi:hypothetical protein
MSQIQRSEPGVPERALLCILGMRRPLLGRAERSIPRSPAKGARLWRAGVDGESARRAIMAKATEPLAGRLVAPLESGEEEAFATLRQPVRHELSGAPEGIRTPDPQIQSLYQVIDFPRVCSKWLCPGQ